MCVASYLIIFNILDLQVQTVEPIIEPNLNMMDNIGNHGLCCITFVAIR